MCHARSAWWLETKSYAPRRIPSRRSVHSTEHKECARLRSRSVVPPSPPPHPLYFCFAGGFSFFFFFFWWGGGGRSGFSLKGETDGIQSGLGFAKTIFWGKGFGKTETNVFEIRRDSGLDSARRKGAGGGMRAGFFFWRRRLGN